MKFSNEKIKKKSTFSCNLQPHAFISMNDRKKKKPYNFYFREIFKEEKYEKKK